MSKLRGAANLIFTGVCTTGFAAAGIGVSLVTQDAARFRSLERAWASALARFWGMEVTAVGADRLGPGPYLFMANHQSQVDIVALFLTLPVVPGFLAKRELRNVPLFGRAMEYGGHVFVDRGRREQAVAAVASAAETIRNGASVVVFPEGTRNAAPTVRPFKKGPFHLALAAGVPVVPVGIRGTRDILPKHSRTVVAGSVEVHVGEPIAPAEFASMDVASLSERVRTDIARLCAMPLS